MTVSELVAAVEHGAHTVPQIAAELHEPQWSEVLREQLHRAVLTSRLVAVGHGRYELAGGTQS